MRKSREQLDAEMGLEPQGPEAGAEATSGQEQNREGTGAGPSLSSPESAAGDHADREAAEPPLESPEAAPEAERQPGEASEPLSEALQKRLVMVLESMLFVAGEPQSAPALLKILRQFHPELSGRQLRQLLERLRVDLREQGRGIRLAEVAGGWQLRTPSEAAPYLRKMISRRPPRMTKATLETLAIVAYRQPVTRAEVEEIRGVDCGAVLRHLLDKQLIKIIGRKDEPGRPLLYGTTTTFLEFFSLKDLQSLPTLKDFAELSEEAQQQLGIASEDQDEAAAAEEPLLEASDSDGLAPPGDDEVVQELAEALAAVSSRDRRLQKELRSQVPGQPAAAGAPEDEGTSADSAAADPAVTGAAGSGQDQTDDSGS